MPPEADICPRCLGAKKWGDMVLPKDGLPGPLILDHAWRKYADVDVGAERLDAKAYTLMATTAALSTVLVSAAGVKALPLWPIIPSLVFLSLAMALATIARRPTTRSGMCSIRTVIDAFPLPSGQHEAWIAASLHRSCEELLCRSDWKASFINRASWAACLGVLWFPAAVAIWSILVPSRP